ncbi:MAG: hypothetical protein N3A66_01320, partial [Planctomycetota bacterium]|nr:hypothetical protein [Planctomycetota bacterium]
RDNWGSIRKLRVNFNRQVKPGTIGMWDLPPLAVRAQRLAGRGLDDTLGAAILVWLVETAAQRRWRRPFDVLLTRAEEIGAPAAWVAAAALPPGKAIITIEMPNAIGEIRAGDGAIIRTGDAVTSFDPQILAHIEAEAQRLARRNPWFRFQRRLGWRGGTESTIFGLCGLRVAGISLPIVNYHNIGPANRPAAEQADLGDLRSLLLLLETLARRPFAPKRSWQDLRRRLGQRLRRMALRLKKKVRSEHKYSVNR